MMICMSCKQEEKLKGLLSLQDEDFIQHNSLREVKIQSFVTTIYDSTHDHKYEALSFILIQIF